MLTACLQQARIPGSASASNAARCCTSQSQRQQCRAKCELTLDGGAIARLLHVHIVPLKLQKWGRQVNVYGQELRRLRVERQGSLLPPHPTWMCLTFGSSSPAPTATTTHNRLKLKLGT